MRLILPLSLIILLSACSSKSETQPYEAQNNNMEVEVLLSSIHRCSRISPEIRVDNIPQGTKSFNVHLVEHGREDILLGGGTYINDGSGIIPEGALTRIYRGPCPPLGQIREYSFAISAQGVDPTKPLAVRLYKFTQE